MSDTSFKQGSKNEFGITNEKGPDIARIRRKRDKKVFLFAVAIMLICTIFVAGHPQLFWAWYIVLMPVVYGLRIFDYYRPQASGQIWSYFLFDFCYMVNYLTLVNIFIFNSSEWFFKAMYICANGPLVFAVIIWRNSYVFHDLDKILSCCIHILPSLLYYCARWYGASRFEFIAAVNEGNAVNIVGNNFSSNNTKFESNIGLSDFVNACLIYLCWQLLYFVKTEVIDAEFLNRHPGYITSLRWLAVDKKNATRALVLNFTRKLKIFRNDEDFDATKKKTLYLFLFAQFIFTLAMMPVAYITYRYKFANALFLVYIASVAVYNGANYYIEKSADISNRYKQNQKSD